MDDTDNSKKTLRYFSYTSEERNSSAATYPKSMTLSSPFSAIIMFPGFRSLKYVTYQSGMWNPIDFERERE